MNYQRKSHFGVALSLRILLMGLAVASGSAWAQAVNAGEIRGTVTDPSGAVIPAVNVSIVNTRTGVTTEVVTNQAGIYDALSILPGNYTLTFTKEGFNKLLRAGIDLQIQVLTVNAQLAVGATSQSVEVSAEASLLRTESGEQGATLGSAVIQQLPNIGQNWTNFTNTLPGVTGTGTDISVNGTQRYEGAYYSDGGNVVLPRSNNLDSSILFESIAQVQIVTANFNAQYGSGTAVFNQITKSGTNQFHGSAYLYDQNDAFNARSFFQKVVPRTRWNEYGASIGGPVVKDKLFFYFNYDSTISRGVSNGFTFYPTQAMRNGDFSYPGFMNADGNPRLVYDPKSLANGVRTPFPQNKIPQSIALDPLALKLQSYMPMPNQQPGTLDSHYVPLAGQAGVIANNFYYYRTSVSHPYNYLYKLDYSITASNRLSASMMRRKSKTITDSTYNEAWPVNTNDGISGGITGQITDVWTLSPTIVNEFRSSVIRQSIRNIPASLNKGYIAKLGIGYALGDVFPNLSIGGPIGGVTIGPGTSATMGETTYSYSDTLTYIHGRHIIKAGGQHERNADNGGDWGDIISAQYNFNPTFTTSAPGNSASGLGYADFLTGQVSGWAAKLSPVVGIRMRAAQMFVQDDYKLRPNLTINYGVRYEIQGGWGEVANRLASFDPTIMNPATNAPGAMWYAGSNGRNNLQKTVYSTVLPRIGFAWFKDKWSARGAFGMFSNRWGADVYAVNAVRNPTAFYTTGSMNQTDNVNPVFALSDPNPKLTLFVPSAATRTPGALNGQSVAYFPYDTAASKLYSWNFGIQRELPHSLIAEVSYVGNKARNLWYPRDVNQVPENKLGPGNMQPNRPYPQFQSVGGNLFDGISNYNGLQMALRKRLSAGLSMDANYTWSKNLNNVDSGGWADENRSGKRYYQRAYAPMSNYGISTNNIPHAFKLNATYALPFGKGQRFLKSNMLADLAIGGWQVSGIFMKQSGIPFTPVVAGANNSGSLAGYWYPNRVGNGTLSNPTLQKWFDTSAFAVPTSYTYGNSGRNILVGPGRTTLDFSMGKAFSFSKLREGMQLQIRMDATNVLNHPCFANPDNNIGASTAGVITATSVNGRFLQLGARFVF